MVENRAYGEKIIAERATLNYGLKQVPKEPLKVHGPPQVESRAIPAVKSIYLPSDGIASPFLFNKRALKVYFDRCVR